MKFDMLAKMSFFAASAACLMAMNAASLAEDPKYPLPKAIREAGVLRNYVTVPNPPMEVLGEDGQLSGFDIDLANALGEELGIKLTNTSTQDFGAMAPALQSGRADMLLASMFDLKSRQESFTMVDYFRTSNQFLMLKKDEQRFKKLNDLCGQAVIAQTGTSFAQLIQETSAKLCDAEGKPAMSVVSITGIPSSVVAMKTGRAVATLLNSENVGAEIRRSPDEFAGLPEVFNENFYGIAVRRTDPELSESLRAALQALIDSGKYGEILAKHGLTASGVDKASINAALN